MGDVVDEIFLQLHRFALGFHHIVYFLPVHPLDQTGHLLGEVFRQRDFFFGEVWSAKPDQDQGSQGYLR